MHGVQDYWEGTLLRTLVAPNGTGVTSAVVLNTIHIGTRQLHVHLVMLGLEGSLLPCARTMYLPDGCSRRQIGGLHLGPLAGLTQTLSGILEDANSVVVMKPGSLPPPTSERW